jgi:hypothetical protein
VLANTLVVVPYMTWDVADDRTILLNESGYFGIPKTDECVCLKKSASVGELVKPVEKGPLVFVKGHRRAASDTTGMGPINETFCSVNSR